jgi:hypothetical protein
VNGYSPQIGDMLMKYTTKIQEAANDPEQLEVLYQSASQANEEAEFRADLQEIFEKTPDNILLSAWHSRFSHQPLPKPKRTTHWGIAVALGVITGLILWAISDFQWLFLDKIPYFLLLWAPITTIPTLIYLAVISKRNYLTTALSCIGLIVACVYSLLLTPGMSVFYSRDYLILMIITLPLLCWIGIGVSVLGFKSSDTNRFAFLIKSIEVMITAGIYLIFGVALGMITLGMFSALNVTPPELIMRLLVFGGFGLIPIMAVATIYDPQLSPEEQDFNQGLSKFIFTLVRLLLPLTILVLVTYIFVIPFNFIAPYQNRNLLIVYNVMQFAIIGLLIGATPLKLDDLSKKLQTWLRRGIITVSILALVISIYALSAVIYRTLLDEITLNRTTIIGWNSINIVLLFTLLLSQFRKNPITWNERLQKVFSKATTAYLVWSILLIVVLPLIFR